MRGPRSHVSQSPFRGHVRQAAGPHPRLRQTSSLTALLGTGLGTGGWGLSEKSVGMALWEFAIWLAEY